MSQQGDDDAKPTHIDIGGVALPREALLEVLPDIDRFEQHLPDALRVDRDMTAGDGSIPAYVREWPQARVDAAVTTLKEVGSLRQQAGEQMSATTTSRNPSP